MSWLGAIGDSFLATSLRQNHFISDPSIKSGHIAILFSSEGLSDQQETIHFAQNLKKEIGLQTSILGFMNKKLDPSVRFAFYHYSLSDLSILSKPSNHKISLFAQRPYYAVINLDRHNHVSLHYINAQLNAIHKLAIHPKLPKLYDIVINPEPHLSTQQIHDQILDIFNRIAIPRSGR